MNTKPEKEVVVTLTISEWNKIIDSLGHQPFKEVYKLIEKIHIQANIQLKETKEINTYSDSE